jgi:sortase A
MSFGKNLQTSLLVAGVALVAFSGAVYLNGRFHSRMSVARFHSEADGREVSSNDGNGRAASLVDTSLWSEKRIHAYQETLAQHFDEPLAVLRINRIHLEVPVFNGTDDRTLDRGVGRILGTALVGQPGNLGVAGHRDGFFRGLKDINVGDTVELETRGVVQSYTIDSIKIVSPSDVSVLSQDGANAITMVTCFPFYFIGSAPQRYIVHATLNEGSSPGIGPVKASFEKPKENSQ